MLGGQAEQRVLHPLSPVRGERIWAWLPQNVQLALQLDNTVSRRAIHFALEVNRCVCASYTEILHGDLRQPIWKMRINQEQIGGGVREHAKECSHYTQDGRGRPRLRPVCFRVEPRERGVVSALMASENFG